LVACVLTVERWGWKVTSPTFILLGDATYSVYLTHPFVTGAMQHATDRLNLGPAGATAFLVVSIVLAAVVGILVYKYVELPLGALARKIRLPGAPARKPRPAPAMPEPANDGLAEVISKAS
jgi:exopolysaccharide production protein ExoZ